MNILTIKTNDFLTWKDHLRNQAILILLGSFVFSFVLILKIGISSNDTFLSTISVLFVLSISFTSLLIIPYSIINFLLHHFFDLKFIITLCIHLMLTAIITLVMQETIVISSIGGFVFGILGFMNLIFILQRRIKQKNKLNF